MKKLVLFCFVILATFTAKSQTFSMAILNTNVTSKSTDVETDSFGNIYVVGTFEMIGDFNPGPGTLNLFPSTTGVGLGNIFCAKYSPSGSLIWVRQIGDQKNFDSISMEYYEPRIAIDSSNNLFISGLYKPFTDFDPGTAIYNIPQPNTTEINQLQFIAKYTSEGNFVWAKGIDSPSRITIQNIETDSANNVYLSGAIFTTVDIDPSTTAIHEITTVTGKSQNYVLKLSSAGNYIWVIQFGDVNNNDIPFGLAIDATDNVLITGYYVGTSDFDPSANTFNLSSINNSYDVFLVKYDSNGNFIWANSFGTTDTFSTIDMGKSVATDNAGNVYITGRFSKTIDMNPSPSQIFNLSTSSGATFIAKYNPNGNFIFAKSITAVSASGLNLSEEVQDIKVDNIGNLYFTGYYLTMLDCDPDSGVYNLVGNGGNEEIYLICYSSATGQFNWAKSIGQTDEDFGKRIALHTPTNKVILVGEVYGLPVDFDAPNGYILNPQGSTVGFTVSYDYNILDNQDFISQFEFMIFPNPATEEIQFQTNREIDKIEVFDLLGKKIKAFIGNVDALSVSDLETGVYIIKVKATDNSVIIKKIVKK